MRMLNIGCGKHFHPAWENIDVYPVSTQVKAWNLRKGLPYPDNSFDVCYHSHVLEHLKPHNGECFIKECLRVLKPDGILRIAVPDLEAIVRGYLRTLEEVEAGS